MKYLMTAILKPTQYDSCEWSLSDCTASEILYGAPDPAPDSPCDWRDEIQAAAAFNNWNTDGYDLNTVEGVVVFLAEHGCLGGFVPLKTYLGRISLPAGAVVIGTDESAPAMIVWEEDIVYPLCRDCCAFTRKKCSGYNASKLSFTPFNKALTPDCFLTCGDECTHGGECPQAVNYPPEDALKGD